MMHATSESDIVSIGPSTASPRPAYYVQSPSQDSQDDMDKCSSSNVPCSSPSDPRHSMMSSSTAISRIFGNRRRWNKHYCNVVAEERGGGDDDYYGERAYSKHCNTLIATLAVALLFAGISLALWGASTHYKPLITIQRLRVENMYFGEGSDHTGVPTKLMTVNCSATLQIYNTAPFFGIYVSSHTATLFYSQLTLATGQMKHEQRILYQVWCDGCMQLKKYYQKRKSRKTKWVVLVGKEVPLYGAGVALAASDGIPLKLEFQIQSIAYLLGKLIKTKHTVHFSCEIIIDSKNTEQITYQKSSCIYL